MINSGRMEMCFGFENRGAIKMAEDASSLESK